MEASARRSNGTGITCLPQSTLELIQSRLGDVADGSRAELPEPPCHRVQGLRHIIPPRQPERKHVGVGAVQGKLDPPPVGHVGNGEDLEIPAGVRHVDMAAVEASKEPAGLDAAG